MDAELELARLRASLEEWRRYLAGPCTPECIEHQQIDNLAEPYNGHRHWTEWYEYNRSAVVAVNCLLDGQYDYPVTLNGLARGGRS